MKKMLAAVIAALMLTSLLCVFASADATFDDGDTVFTLIPADRVGFENNSTSTASVHPRGKSTIECLIDGDAALDVGAHNEDGIVLVCNDYIKPKYEENMKDTSLSSFMVEQAPEDIPTYSFVLEYNEKVTFDAIYVALFHETNACVAIPGNNAVTVEYSNNGKSWDKVGGDHYFRTVELDEYKLDDTSHNCDVVERMIPLSKEITAKCVRLTFNFAEIPEDNEWRYYSNVYEWVGFTELSVAKYTSGEEPEVMDEYEAAVPDADIQGEWIAEIDTVVAVYKFDSGKYESLFYSKAEYDVDPVNTEPAMRDSGEYRVDGNKVTLISESEDIEAATLEASFDEDGYLALDDGTDKLEFTPYVAPEPDGESSGAESSEAESSEVSEDKSESSEVSEESKKPAGTSSYAPSNEKESDGLSGGIIAAIAGGAVVIIGIIVFVIVKKKK